MDFASQIVPAIVTVAASLMSGKHASVRWETVTAIFGWTGGFSLPAWIIAIIFARDSTITVYLGQIAVFCLLTALCRDYEKILWSLFPWNR